MDQLDFMGHSCFHINYPIDWLSFFINSYSGDIPRRQLNTDDRYLAGILHPIPARDRLAEAKQLPAETQAPARLPTRISLRIYPTLYKG